MRVTVLGSNSFSGSHFVDRLLGENHEVLCLSRSSEVDIVFRPYAWRDHSGRATFLQVDLNDAAKVSDCLNDFQPEIVVNFAAQSMVGESWSSPEHWYQTNVLGVVKLANVLERLSSLTKYVHVTTPEVYGSTGGWISESREFHPSTPYAISRVAGDLHLIALHQARGLPVCFTRAANVYGPGQQLYRIVPRALLYARLGERLRLDGGGTSTRSFVHISDVVDATMRVVERGVPGETFHVSTNEIVSIRHLVEMVCDLTGREFGDLVEIGPDRPGKDETYMLDSSRIRDRLGWRPIFDLRTGLIDTLTWVDDNLDVLATKPHNYEHKE